MILIVAFWGHPVYAFYTRKDGFLKKKSEPIGGTATPIVSPLNSPLDASLFLHLAAHKRRHILFVHWRRNEFESWGGDTGYFVVVALHFLALQAQLVVLVSAFVVVSRVWSVSCLPFFYSRCPLAQPFVKVGARAPHPCPMESVPLSSFTCFHVS